MKKLLLLLLPLFMVMSCDVAGNDDKDDKETPGTETPGTNEPAYIGTWTNTDENFLDEDGNPFVSVFKMTENTFEIKNPMGMHKGTLSASDDTVTLNTTHVIGEVNGSEDWVPVSFLPAEAKQMYIAFQVMYENRSFAYVINGNEMTITIDDDNVVVVIKQ